MHATITFLVDPLSLDFRISLGIYYNKSLKILANSITVRDANLQICLVLCSRMKASLIVAEADVIHL